MRVKKNIQQSLEKLSDFITDKLNDGRTILKLDDEMTKEDKENPRVVSANKALKMVNQISNIYIKMEKEQRAQEKAGKMRVQEHLYHPSIKQTNNVIDHVESITRDTIINKFLPQILLSFTKKEYFINLKKIFNFEEAVKTMIEAIRGDNPKPPKPKKMKKAEKKKRLKELNQTVCEIADKHGRTLSESVRNKLEWTLTEIMTI